MIAHAARKVSIPLRRKVLLTTVATLLGASTVSALDVVKGGAGPRVDMAAVAKPVPASSANLSTAGDSAAAPGRDTVSVMIDHAKVVRLPERTQTVIVGNPMIADITVQRNGLVVITGKTYGVTNLIALEPGGTMLAESMISVQAPNESVVTVQRGLERESYSCTPNCQPAIQLGDANKYFSEMGGQAGARNSMATQR
ncbi:MAG TPA: pilus assembly protein N-terminal domain-containing protein [Beijerinckiaceae bacterium]|jgi:Flp pilus assembly secretin CpaC